MGEPERAVAAVDVGNDDPDTEDVDDLREMRMLAVHLLVDAVEMLLAPGNASRDRVRRELGHEAALDLPQQLPLVPARAAQRAFQHPIAVRVKSLEAQVLELDLEAVDAQPV